VCFRPALVAIALLLAAAGTATDGHEATATPSRSQSVDREAPAARSPRNASYDIDVRLDTRRRSLTGRETIRWRNISTQPASELQFHLYWNAWRDNESTWLREQRSIGGTLPSRAEDTGAIDVSAIRVRQPDGTVVDLTSRQRFIAPDDASAEDRTVMAVTVPSGVQPDATAQIEIEWIAKIPFPFARFRTGGIADYYFIAQWFPKIGVLEDAGWNTHQFHQSTEFYADYGVYDVRITTPREFVVGASGREVQRTDNADETTTHQYRGEDIADFAWTASPDFIEARQTFEHPTLPRVEMRLLLQPEHQGQQDRHFSATAAALKYFGEWFGPYPYDHMTIVDPAYQSGSQGMEYPTLFTAGTRWLAPREVTVPEAVTIHEAGHQFWYGVVGTNEAEHAWMDEGLTTFSTARVIDEAARSAVQAAAPGARTSAYARNRLALRFFGGFVPWVIRDIGLTRATDGNRLSGYRDAAEADVPSTPSFRYWPGTATAMTYSKTSLWLHTLERHLGWPVLRRILSTYFGRWQFRHPTPADFFAIVNEVSGQDMTWFFDQVHRSSNVFDYGVQELSSERSANGTYRATVVARRFGEATFPVDVVTTFADGAQVKERWDGVDRRATYVYHRPSPPVSTEVDPLRVLLLDVNYTNNSRTLEPRREEASLKWSLKWMAWMQELMLTYAFFV
jgi:hypothetical protein